MKFITKDILDSSNRPKIDLLGAGDKLVSGQNITLLCSAEGGNPPPQLLWTNKVGTLINSTFQYDFTNQVNLRLEMLYKIFYLTDYTKCL